MNALPRGGDAPVAAPATRAVVDALYEAFGRGDAGGMLALLTDDVSVRFLGQADLRGVEEAARFFAFAGGLLKDVDFRIERKIIDGEWAAVIWNESATTTSGEPWENHGVDVIRVQEGRISVLHENNDVRLVARHFPRYTKGPSDLSSANSGNALRSGQETLILYCMGTYHLISCGAG
jgi:ketosteroid isomerase-like protein